MKKILLITLVLLVTVGCGGSDDSLSYEEEVYSVMCRAQTWMCDDEELRQDFIENPHNVTGRLIAFEPARSTFNSDWSVTSSFEGTLQKEMLNTLRNMDIGHKRYFPTHIMLELSIERWIETAQNAKIYLAEEESILAKKAPDYFENIRSLRARKPNAPPLGYYDCDDIYYPDYERQQLRDTWANEPAEAQCMLLERENTVLEQIMNLFIFQAETGKWEDSYDEFLKSGDGFRNLAEEDGMLYNPYPSWKR